MSEQIFSGLVLTIVLTSIVAAHEAFACWSHLVDKLLRDGSDRQVMDCLCEERHDD